MEGKNHKKKLIIIRGPIAAGKTTLVGSLKNKLKNASAVDYDVFKVMIDHTKPSSWRRQTAFRCAAFLINEIMKKGRAIIVDTHATNRNQYLALKKIAKQNGYSLFSFLLYPPLDFCFKLNAGREIPGIKYKIGKKIVRDYWKNIVFIKGEPVFDPSRQSHAHIARQIIAQIEKNPRMLAPNEDKNTKPLGHGRGLN